MPHCLTCAKSVGYDDQSFAIGTNKDIQNALCKHFWFGENQYLKSTICCPCWCKIADFHRFYCEVEEIHSQQLFPPITLLEIKQEHGQHGFATEQSDTYEDNEGVTYAINKEEFSKDDDDDFEVKGNDHGSEPEKLTSDIEEDNLNTMNFADVSYEAVDVDEDCGRESDDSEELINSENDDENDGEDDSRQDESKLDIHTRATDEEIQEYVSKNLPLDCNTCSERYTTFRDLQKHSKEKHGRPATVTCCNRKLMNSYRFDDHIQYHMNPNRFQCSECSRKCPNREALSRHIRKVHTPGDKKIHECHVCHKKFTSKHNLKKHVTIHGESIGQTIDESSLPKEDMDHEKIIAENVALECDSCKEKFTSYQALQTHSKSEHQKQAVVFCCGSKFYRKALLIQHIFLHVDPTRFQCKICHKQLAQAESLKRHMDKNHSPEASRTLKCSMCPKMFTHKRFLNIHERYHNRSWHCEICDKRFICEAVLKQHHKSIHTKELKYVCHVCARTFHIYSSYRSHLLTHDETVKKKPQKPREQCQICNTWTLKLSRHMRLHAGTRTCEICGEECKNHFTYQYHMKNHQTGDFVCSVCGKSFKREIGWKEHMASHTGDVLYSCDFCDRTFNSNANRASHRKKMHPQQWLEDKLKKKAAKTALADESAQS
ncbi:transcription factor grauzone [Aedes aegypti]|uniref:C2H2-type domain-containing protein n=1 Tax=Aedes aegypti TaxID=7159 RepID=A0A6I8THI2_AEDAE|nr:transcription factor grauzone [Aedes aegypti]XP_021693807.1 transcription factor grauzone [Aedes aegypti]